MSMLTRPRLGRNKVNRTVHTLWEGLTGPDSEDHLRYMFRYRKRSSREIIHVYGMGIGKFRACRIIITNDHLPLYHHFSSSHCVLNKKKGKWFCHCQKEAYRVGSNHSNIVLQLDSWTRGLLAPQDYVS